MLTRLKKKGNPGIITKLASVSGFEIPSLNIKMISGFRDSRTARFDPGFATPSGNLLTSTTHLLLRLQIS